MFSMKYVTWFLSLVVIVIAVIVGSVLIRNIMDDARINNQSSTSSKSITEQIKENSTLRLRVEGPVIADENHQSMQIDVTPTSRTVMLYKTYNNTVFKQTKYENNQKAFEAFAQALDHAGFSESRGDSKYAGECALGRVYHLELLQGEKLVQDLWTTSCATTRTFSGSMAAILTLFQKQIPNYSEATAGSTVAR
jgi:hypothetical protein